MSGNFLFDTNIVIALLGKDQSVVDKLSPDSNIYVPAIVLGELFYGARKSGRVETNLAQLREFASSISIIGVDLNTSEQYGIIKNALRLAGTPIPENDIWIAAIAVQYGWTLVSRDEHFKYVTALERVTWQ